MKLFAFLAAACVVTIAAAAFPPTDEDWPQQGNDCKTCTVPSRDADNTCGGQTDDDQARACSDSTSGDIGSCNGCTKGIEVPDDPEKPLKYTCECKPKADEEDPVDPSLTATSAYAI